jgi:type II secretory pathway pseudopilin PulG
MPAMLKRSLRLRSAADGFSIVDMLATMAVIGTVCAIAIPTLSNSVENQRLGIELRAVEREIQLARLNAVSTNRPIRVRFNCPDIGYYRRVELIGTLDSPSQGDDADSQGARRCSNSYYPYPAADRDPLTRPNNDGPIMRINPKVVFTSTQTLEFWPNGTVHIPPTNGSTGTWPPVGSNPVNLLLTKGSTTRSITVNGIGKMQIQ